ncbi:MAG: choice-of-anchor V domain-containing protein [Ignavibacteria bacterium]
MTGRTLKHTTNGCSTCHTFGSGVTGTFAGPDTVITGQTVQFSLTITRVSGSGKLGCDIAAQNGTLGLATGNTYLKLLNGELTHQNAINLTTVTLTFNYTAPAVAGRDTLYATVVAGHAGNWNWAPNKKIVIKSPTGVISNFTPLNWYLKQNYPNPFNPVTKISYGIKEGTNVTISVYDITGKLVAVPVDSYHNAGDYELEFNAGKYALSSGIYFYVLRAGTYREMKRMTLTK